LVVDFYLEVVVCASRQIDIEVMATSYTYVAIIISKGEGGYLRVIICITPAVGTSVAVIVGKGLSSGDIHSEVAIDVIISDNLYFGDVGVCLLHGDFKHAAEVFEF